MGHGLLAHDPEVSAVVLRVEIYPPFLIAPHHYVKQGPFEPDPRYRSLDTDWTNHALSRFHQL
jgi:hypothetical protein